MDREKWYEDYPEPWNRNETLARLYEAENALREKSFRENVLEKHGSYGTYLVQYPGYKIDVIKKEASHDGTQNLFDLLATVGLKARWHG